MATPANKLAMSKALGAAFLNHQVEQLEKTVGGGGGGNWRARGGGPLSKGNATGGGRRKDPNATGRNDARRESKIAQDKPEEKKQREKEADVIVADASLLVNGLEHLRRWCQRGRDEIVIVPLEALNTLDMLKKSSKAAREASRILEKEVGTNPRIRVQQDDAFVLWDKIDFSAPAATPDPSPEWVRRTICSARWEVEQAKTPTFRVVVAVTPATTTGPADRANGSLVSIWAKRAGMQVLELAPTPATHTRKSSDEDGRPRIVNGNGPGRKDGSRKEGGPVSPVRRREREAPLVERVPAPTKVIRVLARGEKLEDTP